MFRVSSWWVNTGKGSGFSDVDICPWGIAIFISFNSGHWTYLHEKYKLPEQEVMMGKPGSQAFSEDTFLKYLNTFK